MTTAEKLYFARYLAASAIRRAESIHARPTREMPRAEYAVMVQCLDAQAERGIPATDLRTW